MKHEWKPEMMKRKEDLKPRGRRNRARETEGKTKLKFDQTVSQTFQTSISQPAQAIFRYHSPNRTPPRTLSRFQILKTSI
jgi:hypothetical protein